MIVGTAGHIDHGKTTLVRALTGVDTDRLPEEKARGISIELGYAFMPVPDAPAQEPIGFVDVPGHERLVHTMLAGATGIDFALLLVAADDGVMPQTSEHLAVLSLLGIGRGAVAITKVDRVGADRLAEVRAEVAALLAGTAFAALPVLTVSTVSGEGLAALRRLIVEAARVAPPSRGGSDGAFRLAIDRVFTLDGTGTVVTGTVHAGTVRVGDALDVAPCGAGLVGVRVRSLHAQHRAVAEAQAGQRCAVALAGVAKTAVARGQWLVGPGAGVETARLDVRLSVWPGEAHALRSGTRVHVHVGAGATLGTVAVLAAADGGAPSADRIAPGATGWVQLVLARPIGAWRGDRVILRDASATRTLAGGEVLDPFAPARHRRTPQRLAELEAATHDDAGDRLAALLAVAQGGVGLQAWARGEGLGGTGRLPALPERSLQATGSGDEGERVLGRAQRDAFAEATLEVLGRVHAAEPESVGPEAARLRRLAAPRLAPSLWQALLTSLRDDGRIAVCGAFVQRPEHGARLSATDERLAQKILPIVAAAGAEGCWARDLARDIRESEALTRTTLARLAQQGALHQAVKDLCHSPEAVERLAASARAVAAAQGGAVTAAAFRDACGLGRKRAIQILEYFDRIGLLRRVGDAHRLRTDTRLFC